MKKNILVLILVLLSSFGVFSQKIRTTAVFDADTTTRPKVGFYGIGVRGNVPFLVKNTGNTIRFGMVSSFGTNYIPKFNSSGSFVNSSIFDDGSNVGIGTTSPSQKLDVVGNATLSGSSTSISFARTSGTNVGGVGWHNDYFYVGGHPSYSPDAGNDVRVYAFGDKLHLGNATYGDLVTVSGDKVGIGTTTPSKRLSITSTANDYGQYIYGTGIADNSFGLLIDAGTSGLDYPFRIRSQSTTELFAINGTGNVGIGTTAPTSKLQVVGLPTYADNAAATSGGLTAGAFYRTSTGVLMVVY